MKRDARVWNDGLLVLTVWTLGAIAGALWFRDGAPAAILEPFFAPRATPYKELGRLELGWMDAATAERLGELERGEAAAKERLVWWLWCVTGPAFLASIPLDIAAKLAWARWGRGWWRRRRGVTGACGQSA